MRKARARVRVMKSGPYEQNYIKEKNKSFTRRGYQVIGRKEIRKAERFRRIHEKRYESNIA